MMDMGHPHMMHIEAQAMMHKEEGMIHQKVSAMMHHLGLLDLKDR